MDVKRIRELREQANPIGMLMTAMEGNWQERDEDAVTALREAAVVIGIAKDQDAGTVFFGRDLVDRVVSRAPFMEPRGTALVFVIDIDPKVIDVEFLCAACQVVKGSHCYRESA